MARSSTTWQKGITSPNPGGRPKALQDLQELAQQHAEAAINKLATIMNDEKAPHVPASLHPRRCCRGAGGNPSCRPSSTTDRSFEERLDALNDDQKRTLEEFRQRLTQADRAEWKASGSA